MNIKTVCIILSVITLAACGKEEAPDELRAMLASPTPPAQQKGGEA